MEVRLAAMNNFVNPTLRTPFMTSDLLSVNLVSAEGAKDMVKDLPDRVLEKAFKDSNLLLKAVKMKQTRPNLIKVPQNQINSNSAGYQQSLSTSNKANNTREPPSNKRKELTLPKVAHRPSTGRVSVATNPFRKRKNKSG